MPAIIERNLRKSGTLRYELLLLMVSAIWGFAFAAQQIGMAKGLGPMTFNALRFTLGCLVLVPVIVWRKRTRRGARDAGRIPFVSCAAAGLILFAAAGFQQVGLLYTSSANSGFITGFYILFVPLIGMLCRHKAPSSLWGAVLVCLIGLYLLSVADDFAVSKGDLLTLICAVLWACQILVIGHVAGKADPIQIAWVQFAICAVLSAVAGLVFEDCNLGQIWAVSGAIAYAGIMSVGVAYTLQVVCQKRCPPAPAAVIMSLEAVFAALAGYLVLGQTLTGRAMVGCGLILCGVLIAQLAPVKKNQREEAKLDRQTSTQLGV